MVMVLGLAPNVAPPVALLMTARTRAPQRGLQHQQQTIGAGLYESLGVTLAQLLDA